MRYESTGEVRKPRCGEYFLTNPPEKRCERVVWALRNWAIWIGPRVIMRPVHNGLIPPEGMGRK